MPLLHSNRLANTAKPRDGISLNHAMGSTRTERIAVGNVAGQMRWGLRSPETERLL